MRKNRKLPDAKRLTSVQLVLDLPQFRISPGARVLVLDTGKTGRVSHIFFGYSVAFPGRENLKIIPRHLLVEIQ